MGRSQVSKTIKNEMGYRAGQYIIIDKWNYLARNIIIKKITRVTAKSVFTGSNRVANKDVVIATKKDIMNHNMIIKFHGLCNLIYEVSRNGTREELENIFNNGADALSTISELIGKYYTHKK